MEGMASQVSLDTQNNVTEELISERRLWSAVLLNAVEDGRGGTLRARREAQEFLFESDVDFQGLRGTGRRRFSHPTIENRPPYRNGWNADAARSRLTVRRDRTTLCEFFCRRTCSYGVEFPRRCTLRGMNEGKNSRY
jgi:hypothetical protein